MDRSGTQKINKKAWKYERSGSMEHGVVGLDGRPFISLIVKACLGIWQIASGEREFPLD